MTNSLQSSAIGSKPSDYRSALKGVIDSNARLLTLERVAELLSVSRRYVDTLITLGPTGKARLRTVREGRIVRVTREDLDAYVSTLRQEAGHPPIRKRSA